MGSIPNDSELHVSFGPSRTQRENALTVAVIGGGIGGLSLVIGLLKHPHINVQVYEAAHNFGEIGAGITVGPNAQRALELIGPKAKAAFDIHRTPNLWPSHANWYTQNRVGMAGPHDGEIIAAQSNRTGMQCVHRAKFLDKLVKAVPSGRCHFGKRLETIEEGKMATDPLTLHFKDGTSTRTDAIIGADGIHSAVRKHILGKDNPATYPTFSGCTSYRGMASMDSAREKLGDEIAENSIMMCGENAAILSYPIDHGDTLNIVVMYYNQKKWENEKWIVPATREELSRILDGWGKYKEPMLELLDTPELAAWAMFHHGVPAEVYNKGKICFMGDAAHATTPFQGQGAAQAIEDALVLETLLGHTKSVKHIGHAFAAYDQVRRPRTQRVVTTSIDSGDLLGMKKEGVEDDLSKMKEQFETRMGWIWNRDLVAQNKAAVKLLDEAIT